MERSCINMERFLRGIKLLVSPNNNHMAKTILETLWPRVDEISRSQEWTGDWIPCMRSRLAVEIIHYKKRDNPFLNGHDEMVEALLAGELFASSVYHANVLRFENADQAVDWFVEHAKNEPPNMNHIVPEPGQNGAPGDYVALMAAMRSNNSWNFENLTFERMMYIFYKRMGVRVDGHQTTINNALCHYICGLARMGHATNAWISSRLRAIRADLSDPYIELNRATLESVWQFYGILFKPADADWLHLFSSLQEKCESKSIHLRTICNEAAEQGFTVVKLVNDAINTCSDFNWDRFENAKLPAEIAIKAELDIWKTEYETMKKNPFARFCGAPGITKRIPNLGLLAMELLRSAHGVNAVEKYQGLNSRNLYIPFASWVRQVVGKYLEAQRMRSYEAAAARAPILTYKESDLESTDKTTNYFIAMEGAGEKCPE